MTERLREQLTDDDVDVARAARLAAAVRLRLPDEAQLDRIDRALADRGRTPAGASRLRTAVVVVAVAAAGSVAFAAAWRVLGLPGVPGITRSTTDGPERPRAPAPAPAAAPASAPEPWSAVGRVPEGATGTAPAPRSPALAADTDTGAPASPPPVAPPRPTVPPVAPPRDPSSAIRRLGDNAPILVDAERALRRDHDPDRALLFCTYYLDRYPSGRYVEEALALAIEATTRMGSPQRLRLARRYLKRFPQGEYRGVAEHALEVK